MAAVVIVTGQFTFSLYKSTLIYRQQLQRSHEHNKSVESDRDQQQRDKMDAQQKLQDEQQRAKALEQQVKDLQVRKAEQLRLATAAVSAGSGSCSAEIGKYDWPQSAAYNVMMQESSNNAGHLNDNPNTGDYSIGCFQINLYGSNAAGRPTEAWLKSATNNVSYAYRLYLDAGRSFYRDWGFTTCKIVAC